MKKIPFLLATCFASATVFAQVPDAIPSTPDKDLTGGFDQQPSIQDQHMDRPDLSPSGANMSGTSGTAGNSSATDAAGEGSSAGTGALSHSPGEAQPASRYSSASNVSPSSPMPQVQNKDGINYLCGGVGLEEVNYLKQESRGYDLMLTFAASNGEYVADVNVAIEDTKGNPVLQTSCAGPILLTQLPTGTYRVHADIGGHERSKTVSVVENRKNKGRIATAVLTWPRQIAESAGGIQSTGSSGNTGKGASGYPLEENHNGHNKDK